MFSQIKNQLLSFITLDENEFLYFRDKLRVKKLKKKEILLQEGSICQDAYFINKGILRYFYNIEGEEITGQFFFENNWYTDYESYLREIPSKQTIQALEETEILILAKKDLEHLFLEIPKFEKFGRIMAENAFLGLRMRTEMLTNQNPEQRYIQLLQERPKIVERVAQHYIASYLGIRPPSLSRIRKRIFDNR